MVSLRQAVEDAAERTYKGCYCRFTGTDNGIDHGIVDSIAFWEGEYIIQMNGKRYTVESGELENQLEILQHGIHSDRHRQHGRCDDKEGDR
jgi:hypothetical protein